MGLFAKDAAEGGAGVMEQPRRSGWTRERGTRNLILWFVVVVGGWYLFGQIHDHFLLQTKWKPLSPEAEGLTIVGTLDARGDYDHNMFRIIQANKTSKVELTEYGWNTIFDEKNGPMFASEKGGIILGVQNIDDETAYRMLEPYLRAGVAMNLGRSDWSSLVTANTPITIQVQHGSASASEQTTLGALLDKYAHEKKNSAGEAEPDAVGEGSNSGRKVDHGITISADALAASCPIVLIGANFSGASYDENPPTMFDDKTYTIHLDLTDEGRSRFFQWSARHANESLVFLLKHRVVTAGRITDKMNVNEWDIGPVHDVETAKAIVDYVTRQK